MDFNLNQQKWDHINNNNNNNNNELEHKNSAKIPRKMFNDSPNKININININNNNEGEELPLFVSNNNNNNKFSSSTPNVIPTSISKFSRGRSSFSMAQWHELELQAVIYRHIVAGSVVPPELLHLIHKSLLNTPYYLHHYPPPSFLQAGYWGKGAMDPEPGRCRRTDGKKWRCSKDVVGGYKYCERHMHRGRNRSRKPVECPTSAASTAAAPGGGIDAVPTCGSATGGSQFSLSGPGASSFDAFQLHSRSEELRSDTKTMIDTQHDTTGEDGKSNNTVLMDFFDNVPRSLPKSTRDESSGHLSSTSLSMSTPGNPTSDFLRLSTGNVDEAGPSGGQENEERERGQISWTGGWGGNTVASVGGPLAEALRSSSNSSPTSVLHQLPRCSAPDTGFVSV